MKAWQVLKKLMFTDLFFWFEDASIRFDPYTVYFVFFYISSQEQENSIPSAPPESMTFRERQRLFSQGKEVSNKVKASRKLMELENELNTKQ